jgi:DNA-directed RNA polymerase specialized sigma24 family protein
MSAFPPFSKAVACLAIPPITGVYRATTVNANRLAGIRRTIPWIARPKRQAPEAKAKLESFAREYENRETVLDEQRDELRADRDDEIRQAYKDDLPMTDIAEILGVSYARVQQIIRS